MVFVIVPVEGTRKGMPTILSARIITSAHGLGRRAVFPAELGLRSTPHPAVLGGLGLLAGAGQVAKARRAIASEGKGGMRKREGPHAAGAVVLRVLSFPFRPGCASRIGDLFLWSLFCKFCTYVLYARGEHTQQRSIQRREVWL